METSYVDVVSSLHDAALIIHEPVKTASHQGNRKQAKGTVEY